MLIVSLNYRDAISIGIGNTLTWILLAASWILVFLSTLQFKGFQSEFLWKATLVATEYGHWLAVMAFFGFLLLSRSHVFRPRIQFLGAVSIIGFVLSFVLFFLPCLQLAYLAPGWSRQLVQAFGGVRDVDASLPKIKTLFLGPLLATRLKPLTMTYVKTDQYSLDLDVYHDDDAKNSSWVLVIHGGGWNSGDRKQLDGMNRLMAEHRYAVISIDYRLAPKWRWPAPREDAQAAVAFIKAHAKELRLNPDSWVIFGRSAGGQIAEDAAYHQIDPSLKGCIAFYAPSDLAFAYEYSSENDILSSRQLMRNYLGGDPDRVAELYRDASPLEFVSKSAPPTLLMHGPQDPLVWNKHSERLYEKLQSLGVRSAFIEIPWATHGFDFNLWGPGGQISNYAVEYFLDRAFAN